MNMHTEHPADLFSAATAERHAKIAANAFAYGKLGPRESNIIQDILREAWAKDAAMADARLHRVAMEGAKDTPTGSRGHAGYRRKSRATGEPRGPKPDVVAEARRAMVMRALRDCPRAQGDLVADLGLSPAMVKSAIKYLIAKGKVVRQGGTRAKFVYGVAE